MTPRDLPSSETAWRPFRQGASIGQPGPEGGTIVVDEEYGAGARITLEHDGGPAPFTITCGVYGCFFHTRFFGSEAEARHEYGAMMTDLANIANAQGGTGHIETATAVDDFMERFP
jgi:hypothetical protein